MSMNPRLSPRKTISPFCGTYPSTLTEPSQLIGRTLCKRTRKIKLAFNTTEKVDKYKDLEIEVERMWELKTTTVRVVMRTLDTIKKGLESYINKIPGNINIHELQK